jgi:nucleoside 2-deoxyribosyltransferase
MTKPSAFISHLHRDAAVAERVGFALKELGFEVLNSERNVPHGERWGSVIQAAIKRSDALIMLAITPESLSSSWMSYEAGMAEALKKPVIVLLSDKYSVAELPEDFASHEILNFDLRSPERAAHEIAARLAVV